MRPVTIPHSTLTVSNRCLGTGGLGTPRIPTDAAFSLLDAFVAAGGNFLDTAHVYSDWIPGERHRSEKTIGRWLKQNGRPDDLIIATKGGHPDLTTPLTPRLAPEQIVADLTESLDCLGLPCVDLYWLHRDDPARPVGEIMETLHAQVEAGKARYVGCSNWQPARIAAAQAYAVAHRLHPFVASQPFWSLAVANPGAFPADHAVVDGAAEAFYAGAGLAVIPFTSQAKGFFSKAAAGGLDALRDNVRRDFANDATLRRLARAQELAPQLGVSVTAIVLAYLTSQPFVAIPIVGPQSLDQLADCLAGSDLTLTPDQVRWLADGTR